MNALIAALLPTRFLAGSGEVHSRPVTDDEAEFGKKLEAIGFRKLSDDELIHPREPLPKEVSDDVLRGLSNHEFAGLILRELGRRRLDDNGNPDEPHSGLYWASVVAIGALLRVGRTEDAKMAERLAAVAQGAMIRSRTQDDSVHFRHIAQFMSANWDKIPEADRPKVLGKTLEKHFGRTVNPEAIRRAFERTSLTGQVTDIAFAVGIVSGDSASETDRRHVLNRVKQALDQG